MNRTVGENATRDSTITSFPLRNRRSQRARDTRCEFKERDTKSLVVSLPRRRKSSLVSSLDQPGGTTPNRLFIRTEFLHFRADPRDLHRGTIRFPIFDPRFERGVSISVVSIQLPLALPRGG